MVVVAATVLLASATAQANKRRLSCPLPWYHPSRCLPMSRQHSRPITSARIWFRDGPDDPAIAQLTAILQRAPFDGFAEGPQLAAQVQTAVAQAARNPGDVCRCGTRPVDRVGPLCAGAEAPDRGHDLRLSDLAAARHACGSDPSDGGRCAIALRLICRRRPS